MKRFKIGDSVKRLPSENQGQSWGRFLKLNGDKPLVVTFVTDDWWMSVNGYVSDSGDEAPFDVNLFQLVKKPKKKPPVRVKTDVEIIYSNGKSYTLKDVSSVFVSSNLCSVKQKNFTCKGNTSHITNTLSGVEALLIKTPEGVIGLDKISDSWSLRSEKHNGTMIYYSWEA